MQRVNYQECFMSSILSLKRAALCCWARGGVRAAGEGCGGNRKLRSFRFNIRSTLLISSLFSQPSFQNSVEQVAENMALSVVESNLCVNKLLSVIDCWLVVRRVYYCVSSSERYLAKVKSRSQRNFIHACKSNFYEI